MKKINFIGYIFFLLLYGYSANAQTEQGSTKAVATMVKSQIDKGQSFSEYEVFNTENTKKSDGKIDKIIDEYTLLSLNVNDLKQVIDKKENTIRLNIPNAYGESYDLELVKADIFASGFNVKTSSESLELAAAGTHYRGIISGDYNSLVALSFFEDEIAGFISKDNTHLVLGKLKGSIESHILYKADDLDTYPEFVCGTIPDNTNYSIEDLTAPEAHRTDDKCVRVYIEVEYDIFQEHGPNTTNFILALFNQSSTIYANDGIALTVSEIFIWDTSHNYGGLGCIFTPDPSTVLGPFQTYRTTFNGDIAHLVSYDFACGGLAAGFDALCNPVTAKKMCFSGLSPELLLDYFPDYPLNPRNLHLFTHEMGHLLGSRHTHACVWNGNNTAIDGCGPCLEPPTIPGPGEDLDCDSCERPPIPANGGTIMSYCLSASGIDFNSGFHPQPRSVILNSIANASCLSSCTDCPTYITHSDDIDSGSYEASNAIYSTATIGSNQDVIYSAGNFISLEPPVFDPIGLESSFCVDASNGSTFLAYIDDCSGAISLINEQSDTKNSAVYTTEDTKERSETDELVTFKNRPNPFTGITTIEFTLKEDSSVTLSISDVTGRQITVLIDSEQQSAGTHQVTFDGNAYPAGMYYYTIQAGEYIGTQKMSLIK